MRKHVLLKAYTEKNLGDDLFIKIICERYADTDFSILSTPYQISHLQQKLPNLSLIPLQEKTFFLKGLLFFTRDFFASCYRFLLKKEMKHSFSQIVKEVDAFVSIGGSIFMENRVQPVYREIEFYKFILQQYSGIFKGIIGANFGPYQSKVFFDEYYNIFGRMDDVCFRDQSSYHLFESLNAVRVAPDVVFNLEVEKFINQPKQKNTIGLSLVSPKRTHANIDESQYIQCMVNVIQKWRKRGYIPKLFSFCEQEGDFVLASLINQHLREQHQQECEVVCYQGDIDSFLNEYCVMEKIICGRFHSVILSILFKQEFFPFFYSQKVLTVLKDIQFCGSCLPIEHYDELENVAESSFSRISDCVIKDLQNEAAKQFSALDAILS